MAKVRVGINGFGRIGRGFVRCLAEAKDTFDLVLINDLTDVGTLGHLLRHDSVHGKFPGTVEVKDGALVINGDTVQDQRREGSGRDQVEGRSASTS